MLVKIGINGHLAERQVPTSWDQVPFRNWLNAIKGTDDAECIAALLDIPSDVYKCADILGFNDMMNCLAFRNQGVDMSKKPKTILGYRLPDNLEFVSIGRYQDADIMAKSIKVDGIYHWEKYTELCTIFAHPDYHNTTQTEKDWMSNLFMSAPCTEVLAIGNFTLLKLAELKLAKINSSQKPPTLLRKLRLVLTSWQKRLAFTVRFYLWKRQLRINGMNS